MHEKKSVSVRNDCDSWFGFAAGITSLTLDLQSRPLSRLFSQQPTNNKCCGRKRMLCSLSWTPCNSGSVIFGVQPTVSTQPRGKRNVAMRKCEQILCGKLERCFSMTTGCTVEKSKISVRCIRTIKITTKYKLHCTPHSQTVQKICKYSHTQHSTAQNVCVRFSLAKCFFSCCRRVSGTWDAPFAC